jgi:homoserine acetyltransferase
MLTLLRKWQLNDSGNGRPLEQALGSIRAKATVMAADTDLYFTPADIEAEGSDF